MPFESKAQRGYLFAKHPEVAKEFASHMTHDEEKKLPEHVKKMASGGHMCMSCGGSTDVEGYSNGGLVEDEENEPLDEMESELTDENGDRRALPREVGHESAQGIETRKMRDFAMALGKR